MLVAMANKPFHRIFAYRNDLYRSFANSMAKQDAAISHYQSKNL